ncbi:MAG: hypothetical protein IPJ74_02005 [Saprospiraceae bacterium]|nr:hypothetical protein [Saprospiraceae bacterium]
MYELDQEYIDQLETLAADIQDSEELQQYLDTEEEEDYTRLKELYEAKIGALYEEVANDKPLQLIPFELVLLDPAFEGLFLPRILGYSVLRGEYDEHFRYTRPQEHFKDILLAICNSANFEILKKRIGQSIQIGFALSSDIWITNLINSIVNKKVRYYLQAQKLDRYRRDTDRRIGYLRYKQQFKNDNYHTAEFPDSANTLPIYFSPLKHFLIYRINTQANNESIIPYIKNFIENPDFQGTREHLQIMSLYANFFDINKEDLAHLNKHFNATRASMPDFVEKYLEFLLEMLESEEMKWTSESDKRISLLLDRKQSDDLTQYYDLIDIVHSKGYINPETQEAIKAFYDQHEGLSLINECTRQTIYRYFAGFINNLEEDAYTDYFEITKQFPIYMSIFVNQHFNQNLEKISMNYLQKLLKHYTDKRGKDYQDIKKFVSTMFVEFGFLTEKEVVELFKTKRKKKAAEG